MKPNAAVATRLWPPSKRHPTWIAGSRPSLRPCFRLRSVSVGEPNAERPTAMRAFSCSGIRAGIHKHAGAHCLQHGFATRLRAGGARPSVATRRIEWPVQHGMLKFGVVHTLPVELRRIADRFALPGARPLRSTTRRAMGPAKRLLPTRFRLSSGGAILQRLQI